MPSKCCVPKCKSNYDGSKGSVTVFRFPKTEPLKSLWLNGIRRKDFVPSKFSVVCAKHFKPSDIVREASAYDNKKRVLVTATMSRLRLRKGAVPFVTQDTHTFAASRCPSLPLTRKRSAAQISQNPVTSEINESPTIVKVRHRKIAAKESDEIEMIRRIDFTSITELEQKQHFFDLSDFWNVVKGNGSLAFIHIKWTHAPKIYLSIVIDERLSVSVFHGDVQIKATNTFSFPTVVKNVVELNMILNEVKSKLFIPSLNSNEVELVKRIFDSLKGNIKKYKIAFSFLKEQVSLLTEKQKVYSAEMLIFATLLYSMAPHAYKFLIQCGNLILPEPDVIKNIYVPLQISPEKEISPIKFLINTKERFCTLSDSDKRVALQVEEIHLKPYFEVEGNIVGMSLNSNEAATGAYVFMITSLCSDFKDTVHILPIQTCKPKDLHDVLKEVIIGLEIIGFSVFVVVTDNSLISRQAMAFFSDPPLYNSIVYKHPFQSSRPLFHLISFVDLLKSIRNDWMQQNNQDECLFYPPIGGELDSQKFKTASFSTLKKLQELETTSHLKYFSKFSPKAISPANYEKHKIDLVLQIFNDLVSSRLLAYGNDHSLPYYQDTADFIKLICTWWSIVNPSSPLKEVNSVDHPNISLSTSDKSYDFLQKFLDWLDCWSSARCDSGMLTAKTYSALHLSTYALLELTAYCKNEHSMTYIFPSNFQTDYRISRFKSYKEPPGLHFITKKRWLRSEPKLRVLNMLTLSLIDINDVDLSELHHQEEVNLSVPVEYVSTYIPMIITNEDFASNEANIPVLLYLGGHCVCSVLKKLNCYECKTFLSSDREIILHPDLSDIDNEDKLYYPSKNSMNIVYLSFVTLSKLCKEHPNEISMQSDQNSVAYNLTMNILESIDLGLDYKFCGEGHSASYAMKLIVRSVVFTVLSNYKKWCVTELEQNQTNLLETLLTPDDILFENDAEI